jgi:hypothetical protein
LHSKNGIDNQGIAEKTNKLKAANTSDEAFRNKLIEMSSAIPDFPVEDYVKYREVEGIEEAIARKLLSFKGQSIQNGIKVRNAVISILLGNQLDPRDFPNNFEQFKDDILKVKEQIEGLGLTVVNTGEYIYGTDKNGDRVASNIDILAADATGKVYVIDVRSGYKSIRERWDTAINAYISFTIEEQVRDQLKQIEDIINTKFQIPVKGLYCLPVIYNDYSPDGIMVEKSKDGRTLIPVKTNLERTYSADVEQ